MNELIDALKATLEAAGTPFPAVKYMEPRLGDVKRNYSDTRKARSELGWTPSYTLDSGLRETVAWYCTRSVS